MPNSGYQFVNLEFDANDGNARQHKEELYSAGPGYENAVCT